MCGIAGVLGVAVREASVRAMCNEMVHRGPDGDGVWRSSAGDCVLGHRRLAIIDLSPGGSQPMVDPDHRLAITYNGEIYNYLELRSQLEAKGHHFSSESDTEVLLKGYVEWGHELLGHLNGMFAFALWDEARKELFCARDRFGEKPFHYAWVSGAFAFASEVKALALIAGVDLAIDGATLANLAVLGTTSLDGTEQTLLRGVSQLLPAHAMLLARTGEGVEVRRRWCYWRAPSARHGYGEDDPESAATRLRELLTDSIRLRLRSDVRVGSCLSGGLDSSAIVSLMRRLESDLEIRTFTGRFPNDPADEGRYARLVVEASRTTHFEVEPTAQTFLEDAPKFFWHADFPVGGLSQFAQYCVFRLAREHGVTVLLDGQGSDEQLGGYGNSITATFLRQLVRERRFRAFIRERRCASRVSPAMFGWPRILANETPARRLLPLARRVTGRSVVEPVDFYRRGLPDVGSAPELASLSDILWRLSFRTMLSSLLRFGDRLSMAHSREVRLPFCDHRVAEFAFALSPELLVGDGQVKRVLRLAIQGVVPNEIVHRPKQGFVPPQTKWLVGPLQKWVEDLASDPGPVAEHLDLPAVQRLARSDARVRQRDARVLWELANVMAWSRFALERMRGSAKVAATNA